MQTNDKAPTFGTCFGELKRKNGGVAVSQASFYDGGSAVAIVSQSFRGTRSIYVYSREELTALRDALDKALEQAHFVGKQETSDIAVAQEIARLRAENAKLKGMTVVKAKVEAVDQAALEMAKKLTPAQLKELAYSTGAIKRPGRKAGAFVATSDQGGDTQITG